MHPSANSYRVLQNSAHRHVGERSKIEIRGLRQPIGFDGKLSLFRWASVRKCPA